MKTIAQILEGAELGDRLIAGEYEWEVKDLDFDTCIVAVGVNDKTDFELWSKGIEQVAVIPGLKLKKVKNA